MTWRSYFRRFLISGLAYGVGLVLGSVLGHLITDYIISMVPEQNAIPDINILLAGLLLAFMSAGLAGGISGFVGGWTLSTVGRPRGRWGYSWQSTVFLALACGTFLYLDLLLVSLLSFYSVAEVPPSDFAILFLVAGAIFGAIVGLLLGLSTVGWRRTAFVMLAALVGFGLGGSGLGLGLWNSLMSIKEGALDGSQFLPLLLGLGIFGLLGGGSLGFVYSYLADRPPDPKTSTKSRWRLLITYGVTVVFLIVIWLTLRPLLAQLRGVLTARDAGLSSQLVLDTVDTHWSKPIATTAADKAVAQVELAANSDQLALAWLQDDTLNYQPGVWNEDNLTTEWGVPHIVYRGSPSANTPGIALDSSGNTHLVWRDGTEVFYSRCRLQHCTEPLSLSNTVETTCAGTPTDDKITQEQPPAIAISPDDEVMMVWHGSDGTLRYVLGSASEPIIAAQVDCVLADDVDSPTQIQLAEGLDNRFVLAYTDNQNNDINMLEYTGTAWETQTRVVGQGDSPQLLMDTQNQPHLAWCGVDGQVNHWHNGNVTDIADLPCLNRPELALDNDGRLHLIWVSDEVIRTTGNLTQQPVIYDTIQTNNDWTEPAIVARLSNPVQPTLSNSDLGILHLAWPNVPGIAYSNQIQYNCDDTLLPRAAKIAYDVATQTKYQPPDNVIPYCGNRYDRILITPGPDPAFSLTPPTPNGGFDGLAELIRAADYEVLISTMDYDEDENNDSPGSVIATAVADLYQQLADNPTHYPRGLTVRILLGNPPRVGTPRFKSQLWNLITDLREAGVPEMVNPDLGWRLEVANYEGAWPHSHAKILVVDGKTVVAAGFNMQYTHLPSNHRSGQGDGTVDSALQITGPVAQNGRVAFDELWAGATLRHCRNLFPRYRLWQLTCRDRPATSDHVPEVMRTYLPGGETTAFSMLRTAAYDKADQQVITALAEAQETIDIMHVQFSLPLVCNLNLLYDVCSSRHALPFMHSILDAVGQNEVQARLLIKMKPLKGIENILALDVLQAEVDARGLSDRVEIRPFPGPVHAKTTLIDNQLLIIGSQNYHWSAYGHNQGLAEYSLGVSDPQAVSDFQKLFEHYWDKAK